MGELPEGCGQRRLVRAAAFAEGALIDVSVMAAAAGFTSPVAITAGGWRHAVAWGEAPPAAEQTARLWQVLVVARLVLRSGRPQARFPVVRTAAGGGVGDGAVSTITLVLHTGLGDAGEPVLTITLAGSHL